MDETLKQILNEIQEIKELLTPKTGSLNFGNVYSSVELKEINLEKDSPIKGSISIM